MQSPSRMASSGRSRFATLAGRKLVGCSAMRAIRFMTYTAPLPRGRKVSQAGLAVKRTRVNDSFRDAIVRRPVAPPPQDVESQLPAGTQAVGGVTRKTLPRQFRRPDRVEGPFRSLREPSGSCGDGAASAQ